MIRKLLCAVGWHRWEFMNVPVYEGEIVVDIQVLRRCDSHTCDSHRHWALQPESLRTPW